MSKRQREGGSGAASARNADPPFVLFLCSTNTTNSIMAEAILRHFGLGRVRAASAGEFPHGDLNPFALECLNVHGIATTELRTKMWGEFFGLDRPRVRFLIALCDHCAAKANWPEDTLIMHWHMPDPGEVAGSDIDIRVAFEEAFGRLDVRIRRFLALPLAIHKSTVLAQELQRIGET
ncbi:MAG TPA: arsenate reductase ArsC [Candidatus Binataceae bacterium]|nr:arsenate reductase ArsC [Candidatus Binataceae bacterium]